MITEMIVAEKLSNKYVFMAKDGEQIHDDSFNLADMVLVKFGSVNDLADIAGYDVEIKTIVGGEFVNRTTYLKNKRVVVSYKEASYLAQLLENASKNRENSYPSLLAILNKLNKET
jgi:hypothetical protein